MPSDDAAKYLPISSTEFSIISCGHEVIHSGSIISFEKNDIIIKLSGLEFVFVFPDDPEDKNELIFEMKNQHMEIKIYNANTPFYKGVSRPVKVAELDDEYSLYLSFVVTAISQQSYKILHYSFYRVKKQ